MRAAHGVASARPAFTESVGGSSKRRVGSEGSPTKDIHTAADGAQLLDSPSSVHLYERRTHGSQPGGDGG
jgi:hypothetical protein